MAAGFAQSTNALGGDRPSLGIATLAWLVLGFLLLPSLVVIPMSFSDHAIMMFPPDRFSFLLYRLYFSTASWIQPTIESAKVAGLTIVLSLFFGSTASYGIVRGKFPGKQALLVFLLSPMFVPLIVVGLGFYIYFTTIGLRGTTLGLVAAHTAYVTPYVIVVLMASLRGVDPQLENAARTMGAGRIYTFRRVTLPLIRPGLVSAGLFGFLLSFDELIMGIFLTSADTKTLPVKMYESILYEVSPVLSAVSTLLTVVALVLCFVVIGFQRKQGGNDRQ